MDNSKPKFIAAIDVGTTKIVSLLGIQNENKKVEVAGFTRSDSKGIRRGEVLNPEEVSKVIRNVIVELQKQAGIIFSEVFVGIAGEHIRIVKDRKGFNRPSYEEMITASEVEQLKREAENIALEEGKKILHVLPQSYVVDNETDIVNPVGMLGRRLEANFNVVVANMDSIKRIEKSFALSHLKIKDIILEPLASAEAVLHEEEREAGVALIDIGGGTTDIAIFYDNKLRHAAVFPYGGHVITKDIKEACGLNEQQAEDLKVQFGVALVEAAEPNKDIVIPAKIKGREPKEISIRNLASIIQARMDEIIEGVMFEIQNSGYADKLGYGIVITGGGAMLRHVEQLFRFQTGMDVRIGYPGEHLNGKSENINEPCYATGVGLLMKGFEHVDDNWAEVSMMNFDINEKVKTNHSEIDEEEDNYKRKKPQRKPLMKRFTEKINQYFAEEPESRM